MGDNSSFSHVSAYPISNDYLFAGLFQGCLLVTSLCLILEQRASRLIAHYKRSEFPKHRVSLL